MPCYPLCYPLFRSHTCHNLLCLCMLKQYIRFDLSVWGISSSGRAPALHAGGTGIDTQILQINFFLFFSLLLIVGTFIVSLIFLYFPLSHKSSRIYCFNYHILMNWSPPSTRPREKAVLLSIICACCNMCIICFLIHPTDEGQLPLAYLMKQTLVFPKLLLVYNSN